MAAKKTAKTVTPKKRKKHKHTLAKRAKEIQESRPEYEELGDPAKYLSDPGIDVLRKVQCAVLDSRRLPPAKALLSLERAAQFVEPAIEKLLTSKLPKSITSGLRSLKLMSDVIERARAREMKLRIEAFRALTALDVAHRQAEIDARLAGEGGGPMTPERMIHEVLPALEELADTAVAKALGRD